jgi:hypothetical protein
VLTESDGQREESQLGREGITFGLVEGDEGDLVGIYVLFAFGCLVGCELIVTGKLVGCILGYPAVLF